ncbi:DNA polymerase III subunit alpha [Melissococcus sp. OM08-11BH]|uniref:DNA polymerase III subunit alpha n=1 Tax=Melissococcus sp. OM08-11BH TaxID=2293110 RepID=UPI000E4E22F9|nr:DNA polymerase III subunit alpha [Melissococcus sp. OM08-11BH]RGI31768.1 DNA polymerase III subunit alpha [Melissococcus sp. OM08-11BH]
MNLGQLQVRTEYSLLSSTNRIEELVYEAKNRGYTSLAITDIDTLHGVVIFYQECLKQHIKPIIGMTLTYKTTEETEAEIILLAKNLSGYHHLMKIATKKSMTERRESFSLRDAFHDLNDLIAILPWQKNELYQLQQATSSEQMEKRTIELLELLKHCDVYGGINVSRLKEEERDFWGYYYKKYNLPPVALQDVRYLNPSDDFSVAVLEHIDSGELISLDFEQLSGDYYLPQATDFTKWYHEKNLDEALSNIETIVSSIDLQIPLQQKLLPSFPVPNNEKADTYLRRLCQEGLSCRLNGQVNETYQARLNMELDVIHEMGYDDYFLIVWDVMKYARDHHIVTACRGSAAGSLVSYVLQITNVDPIQYQLLFERFLNKERYTMPDIDMDIPDNRREELLQYVNHKYGKNRVAQIATFGTLAAKMAVRDVSRVFGLSQNEANKWANAIPKDLKITLSEAYDKSKTLRELVGHSYKNKLLFDTAKRIEGLPRHVSTHAAGVVISDQDLTNLIPLQEGNNGIPLTQFAMGEVEEIGLLKMDFLGLRNLSIIGNALSSIEYQTGRPLSLEDIPLDDDKTLELFRQGNTVGVFQFESKGIKNVLRKLGPTSIEDIASVNALYRPGPMENIETFVKRKKGIEAIHYPHDSLKDILGYTYGVIVYQEQVMQVASKMAGFSLGEADILRRAISKKSKDVLDTEREHFVSGAVGQGYTKDVAMQVYDYIERFANYGFNRSHAVVYSVIAYQMAYLKVHYPTAFFQAILHSVKNNPAKMTEYIVEAKEAGLIIIPPDINKSEYSFTFYKGSIIYGFSSVKGIRKDFIQHMLTVRKEDGPFKSLENFLMRLNGKWLKKANILPLIYIGAFDRLHQNRKQLMIDLDSMIQNIEYSGGSADLLDVLTLKKEICEDFTVEEKLEQEVDYLGTYVSAHPVDFYTSKLVNLPIVKAKDLLANQEVTVLLYSSSIKKIRTKKGESMVFLEGTDQTGKLSVTLFPAIYRSVQSILSEHEVYVVRGKVEKSKYNQEWQIIANTVELAKDMEGVMKCFINITPENDKNQLLADLQSVLLSHHGENPVILVFRHKGKNTLLNQAYWVNNTPDLMKEVHSLLGEGMIIFK